MRNLHGRRFGAVNGGTYRELHFPEWTPLDLGASLALWLRADKGITLNGSTVSAWADQSGNGRHATQGAGSKQPAYVASTSGLNGQPSMLFSTAAATYLTTAVGAVIAQPNTLVIVSRSGTVTPSLLAVDGPFGGTRRQIIGVNASKQLQAFAGALLNSTTLWGDNTSRIALAEFNGASSAIYLDSATTTVASGNAGAVSFEGVLVGGSNTGTQNWSGHIAEVIAVAGASASIRANIVRYLGTRYGITVT